MQVKITVKSSHGHCSQRHQPGDSWLLADKTVEGICLSAFCSLLPWVHMLRFDGQPSWDVDIACPDADNPVVFRLERVLERVEE